MVTLWVTLAGGVTPHKEREIQEQRQRIQRRIEHIRADTKTRLKFGDGMSKLAVINGLRGEKFAVNPDHVIRVVHMTEDMAKRVQELEGEGYTEAKCFLRIDETIGYSSDTFDEVVSKINAAHDH
jgi:hypothetical protein